MDKKLKTLTLRRRSVAVLDSRELGSAHGGGKTDTRGRNCPDDPGGTAQCPGAHTCPENQTCAASCAGTCLAVSCGCPTQEEGCPQTNPDCFPTGP